MAQWVDARQALPPPGKLVLVLVRDRDVPLTGWYAGRVPGPLREGKATSVDSWRVPGFGTRPTHWCDCVPELPGRG